MRTVSPQPHWQSGALGTGLRLFGRGLLVGLDAEPLLDLVGLLDRQLRQRDEGLRLGGAVPDVVTVGVRSGEPQLVLAANVVDADAVREVDELLRALLVDLL